MRVPLQPVGCPSAMPPPFGFNRSGSSFNSRSHASTCDANASLSSITSIFALALAKIDVIELNEAFASQVLACDRELKLDPERLNPNGGGIALGHPTGCSGTRILVALVHELARTRGRYGIATLCVSGGQGMAVLVERV